MAKANPSNLVHELRERIAASSSASTSNNLSDDDALEVRFRTVLPDLLRACPSSSSGNEREVIAVVQLISDTARNFPGVFYHGEASSILPILAWILPFFAEPLFRSRHGVFFEALGSLLSLLRSGARDSYHQFFLDSMLLIQDMLHVASLNASGHFSVKFKCFCELFSRIGELPSTNIPVDGCGLLVDLTGPNRWQPFAAWILKLLSKCVIEGTHYVEGLIHAQSISAACSILCYGDPDLHMACFEFVHIIVTVTKYDDIPYQNLICLIATFLKLDKEGLPVFRNSAYDSSMGICLNSLYSSCPEDIVKLTAADLVGVFVQSISRTKSKQLKVNC